MSKFQIGQQVIITGNNPTNWKWINDLDPRISAFREPDIWRVKIDGHRSTYPFYGWMLQPRDSREKV